MRVTLRRGGAASAALAAGMILGIASAAPAQDLGSVRVGTGLEQPLFAGHAPGDPGRLYLAERTGDVEILDLSTGAVNAAPFLDITSDFTFSSGEQGLLGLAFDPDYASNGRFYVNLTNAAGDTEIRRYERSAGDPDSADTDYQVLLTFDQPFSNHNGGWIGFNPTATGDARHNLYIATGDGGSGNDPNNNAQNINSLLGKLLRINVAGGTGYTSPVTNPFFGPGVDGADEVFAHGLRNPFRASFDRDTGDLYIGDVGQGAREEIDLIENVTFTDPVTGRAPVRNFGWRLREGDIQTPGSAGGPIPPDYVGPIYDYERGSGDFEGRTVTGGYLYRGPVAALQGLYIFADFNSDHIWAFDPADPDNTIVNLDVELTPDVGTLAGIASFGEDAAGNVYIVSIGGDVFQIVPEATTAVLLSAPLLMLRRRRGRA